ncbi:MAG: hypothetical protein ABEK17_03745 [Candidatus Aenigmatarchaeota archaeon]
MEIMAITEEDMQSGKGGSKSWDHEGIQEALKEAHSQNAEEGERCFIGVSLESMAEFYDGSVEDLQELDYTNPNVSRVILKNLPEAGFSKESQIEGRKYAVGTQTQKDGSVLFKVELNPQ